MKWHLEDFRHFSSQQHLHKVTRPASFCLLQGHMPRNTCSFKHSHLDRHTITSPWCICTHSKYIHGASARIPYKAKEDSYVFIISTQIHRRGKTKPDEHMVLRAVMDGREWSAIQKQRGSRDHDDKAAGFSFTVCFPPDAAWQTTPSFYRNASRH